MKYVITERERKRQQSVPRQLWRFLVLSVRFMRLTRTNCTRPAADQRRAAVGS
jgi:hypothetical protein